MYRILAACLSIVIGGMVSAACAEPLTIVSEAAVTTQNATRFVVHSNRLGRDYEITVQQPTAKPFLPGQKLAAIYVLDGGYGVSGPSGVLLGARAMMQPAIVVNVGFIRAAGQPSTRDQDFTHRPFTVEGETRGGGGAVFEAFLREDLKPFIEARYPADPAGAVLFGHSLGGLFAANVFAGDPGAFAGYIIGSAPLTRDTGLAERVAAATAKAQGRRVFLGVGGAEDATTLEKREMGGGFATLAKAFRTRPGVTLLARSYPGENHFSYYPSMVLDGFRFVLPPTVPVDLPYRALPKDALAGYVGDYVLPDGRRLTITPAFENYLSAKFDGEASTYFMPNGPDRFYAYAADLDVRFDPQGLTLTGRGASARAARQPAK